MPTHLNAIDKRIPRQTPAGWTAIEPGARAEAIGHFTNAIIKLPHVAECPIMTGECDAFKTGIPMQKIKLSTELPL